MTFSWPVWRPRIIKGTRWALISASALIIVGIAVFAFLYATIKLPADPALPQSSVMYDKNGAQIAVVSQNQTRFDVPLSQVSQPMKDAVVASEDHSFYSNPGVSFVGIARAFYSDLRGRPVQGGSTITQQLVKNSYLTPQRSISRKVKEAILAVKLDRRSSKDQILEKYLNTIYFGRGAYGVQAASKAFFNVDAKDLTPDQAAYLTAALKLPARVNYPAKITVVRNEVLDSMVTYDKLPASQLAPLKAAPLGTVDANTANFQNPLDGYFAQLVRQQLSQDLPNVDLDTGGYKIYTTLDPVMQQQASDSVKAVLNKPGDPEAAVVSIDQTGAVRALYGGSDYTKSQVNLALGQQGGGSGRQPGSTFKAVDLVTFLSNGGTLSQTYNGPSSISIKDSSTNTNWQVSNYGNEKFGNISVLDATVNSVNTVYAQIINSLGPQKIVDQARTMGIGGTLPVVPSTGLGSGAVSPYDMAKAYSIFMNRGTLISPTALVKVQDSSGSNIYTYKQQTYKAVDQGVADTVNTALQEVVHRGTGTAANINKPLAGKTGTTSDSVDAWFIGYTPHLTTAVWMGYPNSSQPMTNVHGIQVSGGTFPAQIFAKYMSQATKNDKPDGFVGGPPSLVIGSTTSSTTTSSTTLPPPTTTQPATTSSTSTSNTQQLPTTTTAQPRSTANSAPSTTSSTG